MNFLKHKDCMVRAVISATGRNDLVTHLQKIRLRQMQEETDNREDFDPNIASRNIGELLSLTGYKGAVNHIVIHSFSKINKLLSEGEVLIGFRQGIDSPPHIHHVSAITRGWGYSEQGWLDPERVSLEVITQGGVDVFQIEN